MTVGPALLLASILLAGSALAAELPIRGGVLSYGRQADSMMPDPVFNDSNTDIWILTDLYDTLLLPTADGSGVEPGLASSWTMSPDGLSLALVLRHGARFSDGREITTADVKWSLDRARDPRNGIWNFLLASVAAVDIADRDTVVLRLRHPDPAILAALAVFNSAIMPKAEYLAAPGTTDAAKAVAFSRHPVTSGPFVLQSWARGSTMRLARNPFYWQAGADGRPLPYLDAVRFEIVPDDATRILKVQSGELDGAEFIPFARVAELRHDRALRVRLFPSTRTVFANLNVRDRLPDGSPNPLRSAAVREALNEAVYRPGLIRIVTHGLGTTSTSFLSHATPFHVDLPGSAAFDLADARRKLRNAGYGSGFRATMLIVAGNEDEIEIGTCLQEMWSAIGVDLRLRQVDLATSTELYRTGTFMTMLSTWTDDIADPDEATSYAVYSPTISALHSGWHDAEADRLFVESGRETDRARRAADYARIQDLYRDGPMIPLFETPYAVALRRTVHGFVQLPLGNNVFERTWLGR